jgi:hypothetical protein
LYSEEDGSYGGGSVKGDVAVAAIAAAAAVAAAPSVEPFVRVFPDLLILGKARGGYGFLSCSSEKCFL